MLENKYSRAVWVWHSGLYDAASAYLFTDDDLAHAFPEVDYERKAEGKELLKFVASMRYQVSASRFDWLVKMATKAVQEMEEDRKKEVEMVIDDDDDDEDEEVDEVDTTEYSALVPYTYELFSDEINHNLEESVVESMHAIVEDSSDEEEYDIVEEEDAIDDGIDYLAICKASKSPSLDSAHLAKCFYNISVKYKGQDHEQQLSEFVNYMTSAFSEVSGSQFQWMKMLKESTIKRMEGVLSGKLPTHLYGTTVRWIKWLSVEALESFVLKSLETICSNLTQSAEKVVQRESSDSEFGSFLVLFIVLKYKPDVMITAWPTLERNTKYRVEDKILVLAWVISQGCRGYWILGVFMWVRYLLPLLKNAEPNLSRKSRDVIMQVIYRLGVSERDMDPLERSVRTFEEIGVINGERVVPPLTLELFARTAFPADSTLVKGTVMLRARYRLLKNVALFADTRSEEAKRISEQLVPFAVKTAGEGNYILAKKARHLFLWCLKNNHDSFKQWDDIYLENLDGSVFILETLSVKCMEMLSGTLSIFVPMTRAMKRIALKTEEALASEDDASRRATLEEAQNYAKSILEKARSYVCSKMDIMDPYYYVKEDTVRPRITAGLGNLVQKYYSGFRRSTPWYLAVIGAGAAAFSLVQLHQFKEEFLSSLMELDS